MFTSKRVSAIAILLAVVLSLFIAPKALADTPGSAYLNYLRTIYYAHRLEDIYPCLPQANVDFYKTKEKDRVYCDARLFWYKDHYVAYAKVTNEIVVDDDASVEGTGFRRVGNQNFKCVTHTKLIREDGQWKVTDHKWEGTNNYR